MIRRVAENAAGPELVIPSFSSRTLVYKGMLTPPQLRRYFADLRDERVESALALVHSRFSTNTFPSWGLAHPYRMLAHNGEINTLRGNANWMGARESQLASELFGDDLDKLLPVVRPGGSDTATFDNVLELLVLAGRSLPHALMMMVPQAHAPGDLPPELEGFYAYHGCLIEPWDGPAALAFTRRPRDRRDARPQRPAPRPLARDEGRLGRARLRGRRLRRAGEPTSCGRGACSPASSSSSTSRPGTDRPRRRGEGATSPRSSPYGEWFERESVRLADLPRARAACRSASRCAACSSRSATRRRT